MLFIFFYFLKNKVSNASLTIQFLGTSGENPLET